MQFHIETLGSQHDRKGFSCGTEALDRYLREGVTQDVRRRITACYVAIESTTSRLVGYYTLSATGIPVAEMPEHLMRHLPRYSSIPVARLGRLAVDSHYQGRRIGGAMLWDAVRRAARSEVAVYAMVVDAKDEQAEAFYRHHGFVAVGIGTSATDTRHLILPITTALK